MLTISRLHISLGAIIFMSFFAPYGSASLKRIDNNYCLGDEVIYECNSLTYFNWQFTSGYVTTLTFVSYREGHSKSRIINSINLTAIITKIYNTTTTSVFIFHASRELHGGVVTCEGESQHFYIYGELTIQKFCQ